MTNYALETIKSGKKWPTALINLFGCGKCPFKNSLECPVNKGEKKRYPITGICDWKKTHMKEFCQMYEHEEIPTLDKFLLDYQIRMIGIPLVNNLRNSLDLRKQQLDEAEDQGDEKEVRTANNAYDREFGRFERLFNKVNHYLDQSVNRTTSKKVDVTTIKVSPSDVTNLARQGAIINMNK